MKTREIFFWGSRFLSVTFTSCFSKYTRVLFLLPLVVLNFKSCKVQHWTSTIQSFEIHQSSTYAHHLEYTPVKTATKIAGEQVDKSQKRGDYFNTQQNEKPQKSRGRGGHPRSR